MKNSSGPLFSAPVPIAQTPPRLHFKVNLSIEFLKFPNPKFSKTLFLLNPTFPSQITEKSTVPPHRTNPQWPNLHPKSPRTTPNKLPLPLSDCQQHHHFFPAAKPISHKIQKSQHFSSLASPITSSLINTSASRLSFAIITNYMKRIFRRKLRSNLTSLDDVRPFQRRLSLPAPNEVEILHSINNAATEPHEPDDFLDEESVALSETETLAQPKSHRWDLQETYMENYTEYLPYVMNRLRAQALDEQRARAEDLSPTATLDDDETMILELELGNCILGRPPDAWNLKRSLVVLREFIKGTTYLFADMRAFEKFRYLRANQKKLNKNTFIVYDAEGNIKKVRGKPPSEENMALLTRKGSVVDQRQHIIPVDHKLRGDGLPIFKIISPYMSSFRKKVPYMVFRRYRQIPLRPKGTEKDDEDENYELYVFCTVQVKNYSLYRRFIFYFTPEGLPPLKLLVFQNNHRPFADFNYRDTRFRILGTCLTNPYLMSYNPEMKLLVLGPRQNSLCDNIIDKLSQNAAKSGSTIDLTDNILPEDFPNPVPHPKNPILADDDGPLSRTSIRTYILNKMPPFGRFLDSCAYMDDSPLFPKRYSETGKVELYQDNTNMDPHADLSLASSLDHDSLVISTVFLTLQETRTRNTNRYASNKFMGGVGGGAYLAGLAGRGIEPHHIGTFTMNAL